MKQARDLMSSNPACCMTNHTAASAAALMRDRDCGMLPVIDGEGHAVGVITDRDIALAAERSGKPLAELLISEAMSDETVCCRASDSIADVERAMCRHQVRRIVVTDDQARVIGLISLSDLARRGSKQRTGDPDPDRDVVGAALAAIVEPTRGSRAA